MSKIQNLKAIHNLHVPYIPEIHVVSDVKDTKFESNSQQAIIFYNNFAVVSDVKDTKFESNSQLDMLCINNDKCCFRCQRYKIWKQFTTTTKYSLIFMLLFQMSKIQNLKAIHNEALEAFEAL